MNLYAFWLDHADAAGAALVVAALAVVVFVLQDRAHVRQMAGQRATDAALRRRDRAELHERYGRVVKHLAQRRPTWTEDITQALDLTLPLPRTPLAEAYLDRTVADVPSPYAPVFTEGEVRW